MHGTTFFKNNPVFSANCMNHFQATGKQGNRMAVPMFHSDCQWMEEGKKKGEEKRKRWTRRKMKVGKEWELKNLKKSGRENTSVTQTVKHSYCPLYKHEPKNQIFLAYTSLGPVAKSPPVNAGDTSWIPGPGGRDPTCCGATKYVHHNYWAWELQVLSPRLQLLKLVFPRARAQQQEKPPRWEACASWLESNHPFLQ